MIHICFFIAAHHDTYSLTHIHIYTYAHTHNTQLHTATLGIMVIVAALYLQAKESPFENDLLNRAETVYGVCVSLMQLHNIRVVWVIRHRHVHRLRLHVRTCL
jgi:hypothetical protein